MILGIQFDSIRNKQCWSMVLMAVEWIWLGVLKAHFTLLTANSQLPTSNRLLAWSFFQTTFFSFYAYYGAWKKLMCCSDSHSHIMWVSEWKVGASWNYFSCIVMKRYWEIIMAWLRNFGMSGNWNGKLKGFFSLLTVIHSAHQKMGDKEPEPHHISLMKRKTSR